MKRTRSFPLSKVAILLSSALMAQNAIASLTPTILSFEDNNRPSWINNGLITNKRAINGEHSLLWQWNANEQLVIEKNFTRYDDAEARKLYGSSATQIISFWLYNETPSSFPAKLTLSKGNGEYPRHKDINLNFTGWRNVTLSLENDFKPSVPMQLGKIMLTAPKSGSGNLYLDRVMISIDDSRYQWSDDQVTTRYPVEEIDFNLPSVLPDVSAEEREAVELIKSTFIAEMGAGTNNITNLETSFSRFNINKTNGTIRGRHLITDVQQVPYQPKHLNSIDKADYDQYAILGDSDGDGQKQAGYAKLMLELGKSYNSVSSSADKARIAEMYTLMVEHMFDQGFVDGSALGTTHHWGYSGRWWYLSALLMEEPLREAGLLDKTYRALLWFSREFRDRGFEMEVTPSSTDMDFFNTLSKQNLAMILLNPNEKERVALLHKYSKFLSETIDRNPPAYNDGFRPDGTAWRHKGNYPGYAFPALASLGELTYLMKSEAFGVSTGALDTIKKAMISAWVYTNPYVPLGLVGRHPFTDLQTKSFANGMKTLALSYPSLDKELASIYLQVTEQSRAQSVSIFGEYVDPAKLPEGSWSFNGGAFAIHRVDERMAVFKGYNQDVWSSEIYSKDNRFGRYQSHGSVHVVPRGDAVEHGYQQEGWDWNRNPGATTIHLDLADLESPKSSTLMLRSDDGLSGVTSLEQAHTLFSFKHKAPQNLDRFEPSFVMNKHAIATDKYIYLTGNNISNQDRMHNTETTLFQLAIRSGKGIYINGTRYANATLERTLKSGDWIIDDNNIGYYLVSTDEVKVRRGPQTSKHNKTEAVTNGNFSSAWIDHGTMPDKAKYEYIMVMETNPTEMAQLVQSFKAAPRFVTLQSDNQRQVIRDKQTNLYGYTSFSDVTFNQGYLTSVNKPSQTLLRMDTAKQLMTLSGASMVLNYEKDSNNNPLETSVPAPVELNYTVKGKWVLEQGNAEVVISGDETNVTMISDYGMPNEITLATDSIPMIPLEPSTPVDPDIPMIPLEPSTPVEPEPTPPPSNGGGSGGSSTPFITLALAALAIIRSRR
ncbi:Chondroitin sulfate ABC lyase (plasmid) [Vibrio sp. B1REV9]|uniref:chondroitinase family polysaccharide lyase n=1 Tax=Vibrio sp. B1REV9 TaxID=2751179 RepID=UPI001AEC7910|nr:chondroitinase family polysaccharide lyase [Vibrio sp. B1REV9]CAE6960398.1 Chondroitin sulfate ABC lyase [Vibrio sp. B1REV9]